MSSKGANSTPSLSTGSICRASSAMVSLVSTLALLELRMLKSLLVSILCELEPEVVDWLFRSFVFVTAGGAAAVALLVICSRLKNCVLSGILMPGGISGCCIFLLTFFEDA